MGSFDTDALILKRLNALKNAAGHYEAKMTLSKDARGDLFWWIENIESVRKQVTHTNPSMWLQSDASNSGWGGLIANCNHSRTGGQWSTDESKLHINAKELLAAFYTLKSLCRNISHTHVQLQIDNTTAVAYINNRGGKAPGCNEVARKIWLWTGERHLTLSATYIPGICNVAADERVTQFP